MPRDISEAANTIVKMEQADIDLWAQRDPGIFRDVAAAQICSQDEIARLRKDLDRALRALHGFYHSHVKGEKPTDSMLAYHCPSVAASKRLIYEHELDGASYFEGKNVDVLRDALKLGT